MEAFYVQLACLIAGVLLIGFWIYKSKKEVSLLSEELLDKQIVINELADHANRMEKEVSSVVKIKPIRPINKDKKSNTTKKAKTTKNSAATKSTEAKAKKSNKKTVKKS